MVVIGDQHAVIAQILDVYPLRVVGNDLIVALACCDTDRNVDSVKQMSHQLDAVVRRLRLGGEVTQISSAHKARWGRVVTRQPHHAAALADFGDILVIQCHGRFRIVR